MGFHRTREHCEAQGSLMIGRGVGIILALGLTVMSTVYAYVYFAYVFEGTVDSIENYVNLMMVGFAIVLIACLG